MNLAGSEITGGRYLDDLHIFEVIFFIFHDSFFHLPGDADEYFTLFQ